MATLDVGLLERFDVIFPFLLVFAVVFGVLTYTKTFQGQKNIQTIFAFVVAIATLFSPVIREIINTMAPWFVLLFIFTVFILIGVKTLGPTDEDILSAIKGRYNFAIWVVVWLAAIIGIGSTLSVTFSEGRPIGVNASESLDEATDESATGTNAFFNVLFHPKVLGLALLLLISYFTISRLGGDWSR